MSKGFAVALLVGGLVLLAGAGGAQAEVFVWRSADGGLHFSDRPKDERWRPYDEERSEAKESAALDHLKLGAHLKRLERRYHIDANLIRAIIKAESDFNPLALSPKGAMGLMQIMPQTADFLGLADPYDPYKNVEAGTRYLHYLIRRFGGHMVHAIAAYNAGPRTVESFGSVPPYPETLEYVRRVILYYRIYSHQGPKAPAVGTPGPVAIRSSESAS